MKKIWLVLLTFTILSSQAYSKGSTSSRPSSFGGSRSSSSFSGGSKSSSSISKSTSSISKPPSFSTITLPSNKSAKLYETFTKKDTQVFAPSKKVISSDINKIFNRNYRTQRKQEYYSGYTPQPIYMNSAPSNYGIWDAMLMWSILDNVGDRQMYYHHHDEPEMQRWRSDAQKLCDQGNTDVCTKLNDLEQEVALQKSKGIKQDISYVTPGVDPNIYSTTNVDVNSLPEVKICTGTLSSDYSRFSNQIAANTKLKIKNVLTNGSIDNLQKLAKGECDFAIAQNDTIVSDQLVKSIEFDTQEYALLICHKDSNISTIEELSNKNTIFVGSDQGGSQFTLSQLISKIGSLQLVAINSSKPIIEASSNLDKSSCIFTTDTLNAPYVKNLDKENNYRIIPIENIQIDTYKKSVIERNTYENLTKRVKKHWWNFEKQNLETLAVTPILVTTKQWIEINPSIYYDVILLNRNFLKQDVK